jgi:hypothetical protein
MMSLKSWYQAWQLAREAQKVLDSKEAELGASLHARMILTALAERKPVCRHCLQKYEPKLRTFAERFQLRNILHIPDSEADPMLCDSCFDIAVQTYNPQATNIGTSNSGPANLALQKLRG